MNLILLTVLKRLVLGLITLVAVSLVVFSAISLLPGDFAIAILGQTATQESIANLRDQLGLNDPAYIRYLHWIGNALTGDFGTSFAGISQSAAPPVSALIAPRIKNTFFLAATSALVAVPLAVSLGIATVLFRGTIFDRAANATTLTLISLPEFLVGYLLILVFATLWKFFPPLADVRPDMGVLERLYLCALPIMTLTCVTVAHMMRMTRTAITSVLSSAYIETAELKGLSRARIVIRHALPNALAPIATVIAFNLAYMVVGVVVVETIFVYPGIGQLMVDAVTTRDIPVVQACVMLFAATFIILNLMADLVTIVSNPRVLHPK